MRFGLWVSVFAAVALLSSSTVFAQAPNTSPSAPLTTSPDTAEKDDVFALGSPFARPDAVKLYQKAADAGDVDAMLALGIAYGEHINMQPYSPGDRSQAIAWYEKAATAGSVRAEVLLGAVYADRDVFMPGNPGDPMLDVPADEAKAFVWYERAALHGDASGEAGLARLWETTKAVKPDYSQAYGWYVKAAAQCDQDALDALDGFYVYGNQVTSYGQAVDRLMHDAEAGDSDAQWRLGVYY